jgi:hypothetical protein
MCVKSHFTHCQANFKRFEAFKELVEQNNFFNEALQPHFLAKKITQVKNNDRLTKGHSKLRI